MFPSLRTLSLGLLLGWLTLSPLEVWATSLPAQNTSPQPPPPRKIPAPRPHERPPLPSLEFQPLWQSQFPARVGWLHMRNGVLLVGSPFTPNHRAFSALSGSLLWQREASAPSPAPPLDKDELLVLGGKDCTLLALDANSGEGLFVTLPFPYDHFIDQLKEEPATAHASPSSWAEAVARTEERAQERRFNNQLLRQRSNPLPQISFTSPLASTKGIVYLTNDGSLALVNPSQKSVEWLTIPSLGLEDRAFVSTPALLKSPESDYLYAIDIHGQLWSLNLSDPEWSQRQPLEARGGEFRTPLQLAHNLLYASASNGSLFCLAIDTSELSPVNFRPTPLWERHLGRPNSYWSNSEGLLLNRPLLNERASRLFIASPHEIWALAAHSGRTLWRRPLDTKLATPLCLWEEYLLAANEKGELLVFDSRQGKLLNRLPLPFTPSAPLLLNGQNLYLGGPRGELAAWQISSQKN